ATGFSVMCVSACSMWHWSTVTSPFFFSSRRRHTICLSDWSSDVCSSDLSTSLPPHLEVKLGGREVLEVELKLPSFQIGEMKFPRSEERRVGKECRSEWVVAHQKKT